MCRAAAAYFVELYGVEGVRGSPIGDNCVADSATDLKAADLCKEAIQFPVL